MRTACTRTLRARPDGRHAQRSACPQGPSATATKARSDGPARRLRPRLPRRRRAVAQGRRRCCSGAGALHRARPARSARTRSRCDDDADLSPRGVAALVAEFLEALDLDDVTLVGNDTGGAHHASSLAPDHGERIGRLVLTSCDAFEDFPPKLFGPLMAGGAAAPGRSTPRCSRCASPRCAGSPLGLRLARQARDPRRGHRRWVTAVRSTTPTIRRDTVASFMRAIDKPRRRSTPPQRLPALRQSPTLRRLGRRTTLLPARPRRAPGRGLPDARLAPIAGARTFVPIDEPEAGRDRDFVREDPPAPRGRADRGVAGSQSAGKTPGGDDPGQIREQPTRAPRPGAPAISGRTSPSVSSSASVVAICRSAALGVLAAEHAVGDPAVDAVEVPGQRAQVGAHGAVGGAVQAALDPRDQRRQRARSRARAAAAAARPPGSRHRAGAALVNVAPQQAPRRSAAAPRRPTLGLARPRRARRGRPGAARARARARRGGA